jgi:hypothetical protein
VDDGGVTVSVTLGVGDGDGLGGGVGLGEGVGWGVGKMLRVGNGRIDGTGFGPPPPVLGGDAVPAAGCLGAKLVFAEI